MSFQRHPPVSELLLPKNSSSSSPPDLILHFLGSIIINSAAAAAAAVPYLSAYITPVGIHNFSDIGLTTPYTTCIRLSSKTHRPTPKHSDLEWKLLTKNSHHTSPRVHSIHIQQSPVQAMFEDRMRAVRRHIKA